VSVIADTYYNRMKESSSKYTIGYIVVHGINIGTHNVITWRFLYWGAFFILNSFLITTPSLGLNISKNSQLSTARFCPLYQKSVISKSIIRRAYYILELWIDKSGSSTSGWPLPLAWLSWTVTWEPNQSL
jgi:hypothetical protein